MKKYLFEFADCKKKSKSNIKKYIKNGFISLGINPCIVLLWKSVFNSFVGDENSCADVCIGTPILKCT